MPGGLADPQQVTWKQATGVAAAYRARKLSLAATAAAALLGLWQRLTSGQLTDDDLVELGATTVAAANLQAVSLADLYLAHVLSRPPLGLTVPDPTERLQLAVKTAASDTGTSPQAALDRLGRSEPLAAGQSAVTTGMREHKVEGWTRVTSGSPCKVCADLANGRVLSPKTAMWSHPACSCTQEIVSSS